MKMKAFGFTREKVMNNVVNSIKYAKDKGIKQVNFFAVDSTRSDLGYLRDIYSAALQAGADEISMVDTIGACAPETAEYLIRQVRSWFGKIVPIHWHGHNDFGLATAVGHRRGPRRRRLDPGHDQRHGRARRQRRHLRSRPRLQFLYHVPVELDLSKAREVSDMVQKYGRYTVDTGSPSSASSFSPARAAASPRSSTAVCDRAVLG